MPLKTKIFIFVFNVTLVFNNPLKQTTAVNIINIICIFLYKLSNINLSLKFLLQCKL